MAASSLSDTPETLPRGLELLQDLAGGISVGGGVRGCAADLKDQIGVGNPLGVSPPEAAGWTAGRLARLPLLPCVLLQLAAIPEGSVITTCMAPAAPVTPSGGVEKMLPPCAPDRSKPLVRRVGRTGKARRQLVELAENTGNFLVANLDGARQAAAIQSAGDVLSRWRTIHVACH